MRKALARWGSRVSAASLVALVAVLAGGAPALAHHPELSVEVACDGRVSFTARAWPGFPDDPDTAADERTLSRTNPEITISVSMTGGKTFLALPGTPDYAFLPGNGFSFSDTFKLPEPLPPTVIVRARAAEPWGNGEALGGPKQTPPVPVPTSCEETGQDELGGGAYGGADGSQDTTQDEQPAGDQPADDPSGQPAAEPEQPSDDATLATARAQAAVREIGPAGFAIATAGLVALVVGLIAAGLWARRRVIESQ